MSRAHVDRASIYKTRTGSVPGAPLADVIYQLAMVGFHKQLREMLQEEGLQVICCDASLNKSCRSSVAAWVDDLAVPLEACKASQLVPRIALAMKTIDRCMQVTGVQVNYSAGKTEAVVCWRGLGARQVRHAWMIEQNGWVHVEMQKGRRVKLKLNDKYVHLGALDTVDTDLPAEIKHRKSVAQPAFSALRRRVLFNPFLSVVEKVRLVCQGPITSLMHSSGTWVISNERECKALHGAYMSMVRPCVRPLFGLTSRKLRDEEVCCLLACYRHSLQCASADFVMLVALLLGLTSTQRACFLRKVDSLMHYVKIGTVFALSPSCQSHLSAGIPDICCKHGLWK